MTLARETPPLGNRRPRRQPWRRNGRVVGTVVMAVLALLAGLAGGHWLSRPGGESAGTGGAVPAADKEQWYTCGMHPNVLQKGPGECPICHMKLTPLKKRAEPEKEAAGGPQERKILYWRAPMDPNYISDRPGKSPMGMDLVPVYASETKSIVGLTIRIDPVTIQNMGIRTDVIRRGPLVKVIRTLGRVDYNEKSVTFINTKFKGWIERLYVDETGQHVAKGQELFDVYSPELYAAQEEYLAAIRNLPLLEGSTFAPATDEAALLVDAAVTKLQYLDVSDVQIARIRETKQVEKTLTIHSPAEGIVTEKMALEGMYVTPGMRLYTIADLSRIWVYVDIFEYQLPWVSVGQTARMTLPYIPGEEFLGKVVYVYPYLEQQTRVIKVRLEFANPALELKPGMFANVKLESQLSRDAVLIPRAAYIDSGERKIAFVDRGNGKFDPREIETGVEAKDGMVEVLSGLSEGDVVVTSGQFLLDAESKLNEAVAKMMEADRAKVNSELPARDSGLQPDDSTPHDHAATSNGAGPVGDLASAHRPQTAGDTDAAYTCPEHQQVFSRTPGICPRCGRRLMPFKVMYTCPDLQHADVISTTPGTCPRCGRSLVAYRGVWLDDRMADRNLPPSPGLSEAAAFHCPVHPLVHSDKPGFCTICARPLEPTKAERSAENEPASTADQGTGANRLAYVCPMHPDQVQSASPGKCPICGMQLVHAATFPWPKLAPEHVAAQVDYLTEHYLDLQASLASDRITDLAPQALAIAAASDELSKHIEGSGVAESGKLDVATERLRAAALKIRGKDIEQDRRTFVELSAAFRALIDVARPNLDRWPKLYIYHCPMSKGDWVQSSPERRNPYYGFKMLSCGELKDIK